MEIDGFYRLKNGAKVIRVIKHYTGIDSTIVKVLRTPNSIQFWNPEKEKPTDVANIGDLLKPNSRKSLISEGYSRRALYTRFDDKSLSQRSDRFQKRVARLFIQNVLMQNVNGEMTENDLERINHEVIYIILENREHLDKYLDNTAAFLTEAEEKLGVVLSDEERLQFEQVSFALEAIYNVFDYVELGESAGDGDTYILVGTAVDNDVPTIETMMWLQQNLTKFKKRHAFLPGYGSYVTEAALRHRVIMGPDVTEREAEYLQNNVYDVHDYRDGRSIDSLEFE